MIIFLDLKNINPLISNAYYIHNISRRIRIPCLLDHYAPLVPESVHFRVFTFSFQVVKMLFAKRKVKDSIDYGNVKDKNCSSSCKKYVVQRLGKTCHFENGQNLENSVIVLLLLLSSSVLLYHSQFE